MKSGCYGDSRLGECQCPWSLTYAPEYLLILPSAPFSSGRFLSAFPVPPGKAQESFCSLSARLGTRDPYKFAQGPILFSCSLSREFLPLRGTAWGAGQASPTATHLCFLSPYFPSYHLLLNLETSFFQFLRTSLSPQTCYCHSYESFVFPQRLHFWNTEFQNRLLLFFHSSAFCSVSSLSQFNENKAS